MPVEDTPLPNSDANHIDGGAGARRDELALKCLLYLFGELSKDQSHAFEQRLLVSPETAEELIRQSKRLSLLGGCAVPDVGEVIEVSKVQGRSISIRHYLSLTAAIAAGLLLVLSLTSIKDGELAVVDDSKIAEAWAATDSTWSELSSMRDDGDAIPSEKFVATDSFDFVGPFGDETVPSWMLAALDQSSELLDASFDDGGQLNRESESEKL